MICTLILSGELVVDVDELVPGSSFVVLSGAGDSVDVVVLAVLSVVVLLLLLLL